MITKGEDNAFPQNFEKKWLQTKLRVEYGLSKREYMATHILAGIVSRDYANDYTYTIAYQVNEAILLTDALIEQLNG